MYHGSIKKTEDDIQNILKRVNELTGIKESDTGLAPPAHWDLAADKQILQSTSVLCAAAGFCVKYCKMLECWCFIIVWNVDGHLCFCYHCSWLFTACPGGSVG